MSQDRAAYTVTPTLVAPDPLAGFPDDERRIILAWRSARQKARSGVASLTAVMVDGCVLLFDGLPAGKVLLR